MPWGSREREVFLAPAAGGAGDPISSQVIPEATFSTENGVVFFPLYSQLLRTHDALIAVLLPRGIPDWVIFSGAGKFPLFEKIPKLLAIILWKCQKHGLTQTCISHKTTEDYPPNELHFKHYFVSLRHNSVEDHSLPVVFS